MIRNRWLTAGVLLCVLGIGIAGVAVIVLAQGADDAAVVDDVQTAHDRAQQKSIADLRAELARAAVERKRLRQLVLDHGGDPGPDLPPAARPEPASSPRPAPTPAQPSPTHRASPAASASASASASPSPSCRQLPVVRRCLPPRTQKEATR